MSLKKAFGTNKELENKGVWIDICKNDDGTTCRFLIARASGRNKDLAVKTSKLQRQLRGVSDDSPVVSQAAIEAIFKTVLLDWDKVQDYRIVGGEPKYLDFTIENVTFLLIDLPDLLELIMRESQNLANFQDKQDEADLKN